MCSIFGLYKWGLFLTFHLVVLMVSIVLVVSSVKSEPPERPSSTPTTLQPARITYVNLCINRRRKNLGHSDLRGS